MLHHVIFPSCRSSWDFNTDYIKFPLKTKKKVLLVSSSANSGRGPGNRFFTVSLFFHVICRKFWLSLIKSGHMSNTSYVLNFLQSV